MNAALAGLVVLVIGDSHIASIGFFNNTLHDALMAQGAQAHSYGVCSSLAEDWLKPLSISCGGGERHNNQPPHLVDRSGAQPWAISNLIAQHHPDIVIVELADSIIRMAPDVRKH